ERDLPTVVRDLVVPAAALHLRGAAGVDLQADDLGGVSGEGDLALEGAGHRGEQVVDALVEARGRGARVGHSVLAVGEAAVAGLGADLASVAGGGATGGEREREQDGGSHGFL